MYLPNSISIRAEHSFVLCATHGKWCQANASSSQLTQILDKCTIEKEGGEEEVQNRIFHTYMCYVCVLVSEPPKTMRNSFGGKSGQRKQQQHQHRHRWGGWRMQGAKRVYCTPKAKLAQYNRKLNGAMLCHRQSVRACVCVCEAASDAIT